MSLQVGYFFPVGGGHPDQGLPPMHGHSDQGLPGGDYISNTLPPPDVGMWPITPGIDNGLPDMPPGTIWPPIDHVPPGISGKTLVAVAIYSSSKGWRTHYVVLDNVQPDQGLPGHGHPDQGLPGERPNRPSNELPGRPPHASGQPVPGQPVSPSQGLPGSPTQPIQPTTPTPRR
jgi:hypothetical protein